MEMLFAFKSARSIRFLIKENPVNSVKPYRKVSVNVA
jgi:hypothetical protein